MDEEQLDEIKHQMQIGNWSNAQKLFKSINPSANDFSTYISYQSLETILDFALLGFYCREYTGGKS